MDTETIGARVRATYQQGPDAVGELVVALMSGLGEDLGGFGHGAGAGEESYGGERGDSGHAPESGPCAQRAGECAGDRSEPAWYQ